MVTAFPFLFALLALHSGAAAHSPAATPAQSSASATSTASGISLPLYRNVRGAIARRSSPSVLREWAMREKGRITTKYGTAEENDPTTENAAGPVVRRQESPGSASSATRSAFSTAGLSTAPLAGGTATGTLSANTSRPTSRTPVGMVPVLNFDADLEYFATVAVGVPAQNMNVILDTGSADLWIASSRCTGYTGCYEVPTINITRSRTAVDINTSFSVRYGSGSASGEIWQDYVSFGGFNVSGQGFALCDVVSPGLLSPNISGLMGLGFQTLAASGVTPFWQNLYQAGVFPQFPGFAFYLTRFSNLTSAATVEPGGELTLGYLNQTVFEGPINYMPIPDGMASYWLIEMQGLAVNGTNLPALGTPNVAIDTGTTLIGGPAAMIQALYRLVPGALPATGDYQGYYSYPCNASVNVSLTFGGISYNITTDDFNLGPFGTTNNVSTCLGAFFDLSLPSTSRITWVVGAAFLKNVYSVFRANPPSVGFARLSPFSFNSTYNISNPFNNGTFPNTTFQNGSNIPNGFFGPSGATSLRSTPTPMTVTTAIQAGQSSMAAPASARARRNVELGGRSEWGGIAMALLLTLGFVAIASAATIPVTAQAAPSIVTTRTPRAPPGQPKWRGFPKPTQPVVAPQENAVTRAGITGFLGLNTNAIASWFRTNSVQDSTNGNSWCGYPYNDNTPGFAPDVTTMLNNFGGDYLKAGPAYCGLEAEFETPDGKKITLFIADGFDSTWVVTPSPVDIVYNHFEKFFGRTTTNKNDVVQGVKWRFTGNRNNDLRFRGYGFV